MQTKHGISIDVLNANTPGRVPLNVLLEGGITLVRVPHGPFKIRISTPHQTDVDVTLDEKALLSCKIQPGMTELERGTDGKAFFFAPANEAPAVTAHGDAQASTQTVETDGAGERTEAVAAEVKQPTQPPHISGFLVVSARFTEQAPVPGELPLPYDPQEAAFQMNPPREHALAIAANFDKIVPPEKIERRWCSHCRRLER